MDPITLVVTAIVAGAAAGASDIATQAVRDSYAGLKALVIRKFGSSGAVEANLAQVEAEPENEIWQAALQQGLTQAGAGSDQDVLAQAPQTRVVIVGDGPMRGEMAQAAADALTSVQGAIINIADLYADRPMKFYPVYSVAKAALVSLTRSLARELAPAVRVNAIAPGVILWHEGDGDEHAQHRIIARTPLKRIGTPADIQSAVLFLVRDAKFVTGQVLYIDGGRSIVA